MTQFPCKCVKCRERAVSPISENYSATLEHDGRAYEVTVPSLSVLVCEKCGNRLLDRAANVRISEALRRAAGLLTPTEIKQHRLRLELTQKELADRLKIGEATLSRWETGAQIQQRAFDLLLRLYFALPAVREHLEPKASAPELQTATGTKAEIVSIVDRGTERKYLYSLTGNVSGGMLASAGGR